MRPPSPLQPVLAVLTLLLLSLTACTTPVPDDPTPDDPLQQDDDGDGFAEESASGQPLDCDDANPDLSPGMPELCDGIDNNCDEQIDEGFDLDQDGYQDDDDCPDGTDCDDTRAQVNPGRTEICDGIDNNCDGRRDEGFDPDGDRVTSCDQPPDCNNEDPEVSPDASERCNGEDDDCDGEVPASELDADHDQFSPCQGDCDDANPILSPLGTETCNGLDDDCDNMVDEGLDHDLDTWLPCGPLADCDDSDPLIGPALYALQTFDGTELTDWQVVQGAWALDTTRHVYASSSTEQADVSWLGERSWTDYVLEADIQPDGLSSGAAGLIFRAQTVGPASDTGAYYYGGLSLGSSPDAMTLQLGTVDQSFQILASAPVTLAPQADAYRLRVTVRDSHLTLALNGATVLELDDPTFTQGSIGLRTDQLPTAFDNVRVCQALGR